MLKITKRSENGVAYLHIEGELNTKSYLELKKETDGFIDGVTDLTVDLGGLIYISSAGLRMLLIFAKTMEKQGEMRILNVCDDVMEIFEMTGFSELMNIQ